MAAKMNRADCENQAGYALVGVMVVASVCLLLTVGIMQSAQSTNSTRYVVTKDTKNFYEVERTINKVTAWLQSNSKNMVTAFNSSNFSTNFDLGDPVAGANEGTAFAVPTMIKIKGTNNAVQLTNSSYFGTSAFPNTTNIDSGAAYDAVASFQSTDFGAGVNVRLLVVWALQTNGHYQPIFRVDAVTGGSQPEQGVHGINFIKSALVTGASGIGYYSENNPFQTSTSNNQCWSYDYSWNAGTSTWTRGAARSNCVVMSRSNITIKSAIHGNVYTNVNNGITISNGGSVSGSQCAGTGCVTYALPANPNWTSRCGSTANSSAFDRTGSNAASPTAITSGSSLAQQCIRDITVGSNKSIIFTTADQPYYIRNLNLQNNSNSTIKFQTVGPNHKYTLYVDNFAGGQLNGNQFVATNLAPNQIEVNLTTDVDFTLNGTATMNGVFIATPNSTIRHNGNFPFYGAYRAGTVNIIGNAVIGYDEALGTTPALSDINYTLFKASQRYR